VGKVQGYILRRPQDIIQDAPEYIPIPQRERSSGSRRSIRKPLENGQMKWRKSQDSSDFPDYF
jgi:hypothetical protein